MINKTTESDPHPRRHPLFPTAREIAQHPELAFSDHLPILIKAPLNDAHIHILSLNVLGRSAFSGLHIEQEWEDDEGSHARYSKMIAGIAKNIEEQQIDVVFLQEAAASFIVPKLQQQLGDHWEIIADEREGIMSCYNKNRFQQTGTFLNKQLRIRSLQLIDQITHTSVDLHNVWGLYDPFPHHIEENYQNILTRTEAVLSVIVGDTNSRLAPIDQLNRNITTGVVPLILNSQNNAPKDVQVTDYPDGGFYRDETGIHQLTTHILDYENGQIVRDDRTPSELQAWPEYRMVLCLDKHFSETAYINDQTIFSYEKALQDEFKDKYFVVRMAADSMNNKAIGIRFSPESKDIYQDIYNELKNEQGIQFRRVESLDFHDNGQVFSCIFVPLDKTNVLHHALLKQANQRNTRKQMIADLDKELKSLTGFGFFHFLSKPSPEKIKLLQTLRQQVMDVPLGSSAEVFLKILTHHDECHYSKIRKPT